MTFRMTVLASLISISFFSCVSNKKFKAEQARYLTLNTTYTSLQDELKRCQDKSAESATNKALLEAEIKNLTNQLAYLKENNTTVLKQLQDLSVLSGTQAESVKKVVRKFGKQRRLHKGPPIGLVKKGFSQYGVGYESEGCA